MKKLILVLCFVCSIGISQEQPVNSPLYMDRSDPIGNSKDVDDRRAIHVKIKNKPSEPIDVTCVSGCTGGGGGGDVNVHDGSGTAITSTTDSGKTYLDVNIKPGGGSLSTVDQGASGLDPWLFHFDNSTIGVTGTFWQATQPVSGTVTANIGTSGSLALDATLAALSAKFGPLGQSNMAGSAPVVISSDQSAIPVTGTFWQATQPVSGPLTDTQLRATAVPVSGTFFQATQPVSGTVTANAGTGTFAVSGPLTDTQLRATAVPVSGTFFQATQPVSGTVTANAGTNLNTSALNLEATQSAFKTANHTDLLGINTTLGSPFQAGGSIGNTSFIANAGTNLNTSALATASQFQDVVQHSTMTADGDVDFDCANSNALRIQAVISDISQSCSVSGTTPTSGGTFSEAFVFDQLSLVSNILFNSSGFYDVSCTGFKTFRVSCTGATALHPITLDFRANRSTSPVVEILGGYIQQIADITGVISLPTGASTSSLQTTANTKLDTINTSIGTVDTDVKALQVTQGSTTSGQSGTLVQTATTTAAPTYTTAKTNPLSTDTAGNLRVTLAGTGANTNKLLVTADPITFASAQSVNATLSAETTKVIGTVNQGTSPWVTSGVITTGSAQIGHLEANQSSNVAQINGVTPLMGAGNGGTGSLRVNVASDQVSIPVASTLTAETTKVIGTVNQGTSPWLTSDAATGTTATTAPTKNNLAGGVFNTTPATITNGQMGQLQLDATQSLLVKGVTGGTTAVTQATGTNLHAVLDSTSTTAVTQATGTNLHAVLDANSGVDIGKLTANQSVNVAQINAVTPLMGNGITGTGSQRVTIASDNTAFPVNATLQAGSAVIGHVIADSGSTTAVTGNVAITQAAGAISGSNPCQNPTATLVGINGTTSGTAAVQIIAASGSTKIYVCSVNITGVSGTTPTFSLVTGTGTNCGTGQAVFLGSWTTAANTIYPFAPPVGVSPASSELCYLDTGTTPVQRYNITYVQQ